MACATPTPTFSFHLSSFHPKPIQNLLFKPLLLCKNHSLSAISKKHPKSINLFTAKSIDVSKEDKPISEQAPSDSETSTPTSSADYPQPQKELSFDERRRLEEKFAVLNTGIYECRSCGYRYDEKAGDPAYPVPPGMQFGKLPEDWRCPTCGAARSFFESKSVEIAGFAENQQFGLGGNTLTSGQKAVLIYGGLFLGFVFFLSGYFLQ